MSIILRFIRNFVFGVSLVLGLLIFGVVFRVASGVSFDAYPFDKIALASSVGGVILALGMTLMRSRGRF